MTITFAFFFLYQSDRFGAKNVGRFYQNFFFFPQEIRIPIACNFLGVGAG